MKKGITATIIISLIIAGGFVVTLSPLMPYNEAGEWGWPLGDEEPPIIDPSIFNDERAWSNVKIKINAKEGYTYNHPGIVGLAVEIRNAGGYVDGGTTTLLGDWTSNVETFSSGEEYQLIFGNIATTNKSQTYTFIVQGADGDTKPTYIHCGVFEYLPVAEESALAFAFYDESYTALTEANFTATYTDNIIDGFIKATFSASSTGFGRDLWSPTKGYANAYLALVITEGTLATSSAVRASESPGYRGMGTPTSKAVFVIELTEVSYLVDEDSVVVPGHDAIHWYRFRLDFTGCGITGTDAVVFTLAGVVSYEYDWTMLAAGGAAYSSTWFSDTDLSAINCTV